MVTSEQTNKIQRNRIVLLQRRRLCAGSGVQAVVLDVVADSLLSHRVCVQQRRGSQQLASCEKWKERLASITAATRHFTFNLNLYLRQTQPRLKHLVRLSPLSCRQVTRSARFPRSGVVRRTLWALPAH